MKSANSFLTFWLSKIIFKTASTSIKSKFRAIEKSSIKLITNQSHLQYNECCLANNLLPTYTNIYIG